MLLALMLLVPTPAHATITKIEGYDQSLELPEIDPVDDEAEDSSEGEDDELVEDEGEPEDSAAEEDAVADVATDGGIIGVLVVTGDADDLVYLDVYKDDELIADHIGYVLTSDGKEDGPLTVVLRLRFETFDLDSTYMIRAYDNATYDSSEEPLYEGTLEVVYGQSGEDDEDATAIAVRTLAEGEERPFDPGPLLMPNGSTWSMGESQAPAGEGGSVYSFVPAPEAFDNPEQSNSSPTPDSSEIAGSASNDVTDATAQAPSVESTQTNSEAAPSEQTGEQIADDMNPLAMPKERTVAPTAGTFIEKRSGTILAVIGFMILSAIALIFFKGEEA